MEGEMKGLIVFSTKVFLIVFFLSLGFLYVQAGEIDVQKSTDAWQKLKDYKELKTIEISKGDKNNYNFNMKGIRTALEKAGIAERIEIIIGNREGIILGNLGKYEPKVGESVRFQSISDKFEDPLTAFDLRSIETETFQLVFKNSRGETKATLPIKFIMK